VIGITVTNPEVTGKSAVPVPRGVVVVIPVRTVGLTVFGAETPTASIWAPISLKSTASIPMSYARL
jgi:hypothetical protein